MKLNDPKKTGNKFSKLNSEELKKVKGGSDDGVRDLGDRVIVKRMEQEEQIR